MRAIIVVLFCLCYHLLLAFELAPCELHKTCGECIRDPSHCKWCAMDNFNGTYRCHSYNNTIMGCDEDLIDDPESRATILKNQPFNSTSTNVIQIKPQQYKVTLRPGQSTNFHFSFKGAEDYPADLYFLIDASTSMKLVTKAMAGASKQIYDEMKKKTKDLFLGLGTFIDKNALPYVKIVNSTNTYSFRNRLKLTDELEHFKRTVNNMPLGTNYDLPEGGLDALAQVMVCNEEIGWREESRKIVLFLTDQMSHSAGDGKWAGIVHPYDGKCYTENGMYTKELEMDYPSLSIINKLASENEIITVFIVESKMYNLYTELFQTRVTGAKCIAYKETSKEVIFDQNQLESTLTGIYEEIRQNIKLKVNMAAEDRKYVQVSFEPECSIKRLDEDINCKVMNGKEINFQGTIKLLRHYGKDNIPIDIAIEGIKERLTLLVNVVKDCDCETNSNRIIENALDCNQGGTKKCGICECHSNRYGNKCLCKSNNRNLYNDSSSCKAKGEEQLCSGHGYCDCGVCKCLQGFEGDFCECNENSCPYQCSNHGKCVCGKCMCTSEWTGSICDCQQSSCLMINGKFCTNRGKCECGRCNCNDIETAWDARRTQNPECEVLPCPECHSKQCRLLKACAFCHKNGKNNCSPACDNRISVKLRQSLENFTGPNIFACENVKVDEGRYTRYMYRYNDYDYGIELFVQVEEHYLETFYYIGGIFLVSLLLIGLATMGAWKLLTEARDRREYEQFVKQHAADGMGPSINPIYEPATTTFSNPVFRKRSVDFR